MTGAGQACERVRGSYPIRVREDCYGLSYSKDFGEEVRDNGHMGLAPSREYATMATGLATQITRQCVYDSMVGVVLTKAQPTMWSRNASQGQPLHKVTSPIRHQRDTASVNKSLYAQRPCRWQGLTPHAHMTVTFVSISCVCAQPRLHQIITNTHPSTRDGR